MILELTKGEIFELMVSALGGFLLLCKWMKSTNMRKVREYLEKQPLDGLSDCSCLGDFMKRSSCKKLFNYYFLYRLVSISYYLLPVVFLFFFLVDAFYLYNYFLVDGSEVFEKACVPMQQSVLIFIFESVVVMFPLVLGEWIKRNTYEPLERRLESCYIERIYPYSESNAFLGVSICSRLFSEKTLVALFDWCKANVKSVYVLIADEIQMYTFMASKGLERKEACAKALQIGDIKYRFIERVIKKGDYDNVRLLSWKAVALEPRFKTLLQRLRLLYGTEILFRREVIKQILERNRRLPEGFRFARIDSSDYDLASLYILNELAVILYFHLYFDPACQYQISPLPMTPLLEILYDGTFLKDLLVPKKDIGYIEIMGEKDLTGRMIKVNTKGAPL